MDFDSVVKWKMALWKILIGALMLCMTIYGATAATFIDISVDNSTWVNVTAPTYRGFINETNRTASVLLLSEETLYYFRVYNDTHTAPTYFHQRTKGEGNLISVMIGLILFVLIFMLMVYFVENLYIKLLSLMISMGFSWVVYGYILRIAADSAFSSATITVLEAGYKLMVYLYIVLWTLIGFYFFAMLIFGIGNWLKMRKKNKEDEHFGYVK